MSTVRAGTIPSDLAVNPGDAIYVNGGGTWDTFTPSAGGGITIGDAVSGGGANRVLYEDGSQNLASTSRFQFNGDQLKMTARMDQTTASLLIQPDFNSAYYASTAHSALTIDGYSGGFGNYGLYTAPERRLLKIIDTLNAESFAIEEYGTVVSSMNTDPNNAHVATYGWKITGNGGSAYYASNTFDVMRVTGSGLTNHGLYSSGDVWLLRVDDGSNEFLRVHRSGNTFFEYGKTAFGIAGGTSLSAKVESRWTGGAQFRWSYDGSNYADVTVSSAGAVTFDAVGASAGFTFSDAVTVNGTLTLSAQNIATDTTTGMKIGTGTTQKVGFFNATPVTQRSDIGALTDSTGGSASSTIQDCTGGDTVDISFVNDNFASLSARINSIRTALRDMGIMA